MKYIKCNLCGSEKNHVFTIGQDRFHKTDNAKFPIVICNSCDLAYQNPQLTEEELKKYYPAEYGPYQDDFGLLKYGPFLAWVKKKYNKYMAGVRSFRRNRTRAKAADKSVKTFLDFGSGNGAYLEKMRRAHPHWDLYALDNNDFACRNIQKKGFKVFCGDLLSLDLPVNFFDTIYMSQVIEHLNDPKAALVKIHSLLKKGALLEIYTPNFDSVAAKTFKSYWFALEAPRHLYLFSPQTLSRMLAESGFEVMDIACDREPKTAIRSIHYLLGGGAVNIHPIFWHTLWYLLYPGSYLLSFWKKTSIMKIRARKIK